MVYHTFKLVDSVVTDGFIPSFTQKYIEIDHGVITINVGDGKFWGLSYSYRCGTVIMLC